MFVRRMKRGQEGSVRRDAEHGPRDAGATVFRGRRFCRRDAGAPRYRAPSCIVKPPRTAAGAVTLPLRLQADVLLVGAQFDGVDFLFSLQFEFQMEDAVAG